MRLDDGSRPLQEVRVHLTVDEARQAIDLLTDLLDDIVRLGFATSHTFLTFGAGELGLFAYADAAALEADF
jgi:hypothetical protein